MMFSYRYFAQELGTFLTLVRDPSVPLEDLQRAMLGLGHVYLHTTEPADPLERLNFHKAFEIAATRYTQRQAGDVVPPAPGAALQEVRA